MWDHQIKDLMSLVTISIVLSSNYKLIIHLFFYLIYFLKINILIKHGRGIANETAIETSYFFLPNKQHLVRNSLTWEDYNKINKKIIEQIIIFKLFYFKKYFTFRNIKTKLFDFKKYFTFRKVKRKVVIESNLIFKKIFIGK